MPWKDGELFRPGGGKGYIRRALENFWKTPYAEEKIDLTGRYPPKKKFHRAGVSIKGENHMIRKKRSICLILFSLLAAASSTFCIADEYKAAKALVEFQVFFTDASWDGKRVPKGQQCRKYGGKAGTPPLRIDHVPAGANAIIMEFSDRDYPKMDNGGRGNRYYVTVKAVFKDPDGKNSKLLGKQILEMGRY